jgi:hypothetical protein
MQVNRNTWRGVYDIKGLSGDIEYNSNAGGEILNYYLTRHAIRKKENKQPGTSRALPTLRITAVPEPLDAIDQPNRFRL